ncbi:MAG: hypothetical protein ACP5UZ_00595 [Thermoplasmata archaeon]
MSNDKKERIHDLEDTVAELRKTEKAFQDLESETWKLGSLLDNAQGMSNAGLRSSLEMRIGRNLNSLAVLDSKRLALYEKMFELSEPILKEFAGEITLKESPEKEEIDETIRSIDEQVSFFKVEFSKYLEGESQGLTRLTVDYTLPRKIEELKEMNEQLEGQLKILKDKIGRT